MTDMQLKDIEKEMENATGVYLVVCYARWCVREYKWTGDWAVVYGRPCPVVWDYDDHNGEYEEYARRPILITTTGRIMDWTFYRGAADKFVELLNEEDERSRQKSEEVKN